MITYYDFGPAKGRGNNAVVVAAADEYGRIVHYYTGYVSHRYNDVKLYPGAPARGSSYQAARRNIPIDSLLPRERIRLLGEESVLRHAATDA